ncbi:MAG: 4Fe-4S dicluster domain-containing protein [Planctomycetota bacterium]
MSRREFLKTGGCGLIAILVPGSTIGQDEDGYDWEEHLYAYVVDTRKCIGCGLCVQACSRENDVPEGFFRTWVERYTMAANGEVEIDSPHGAMNGFDPTTTRATLSFFVPKLCNHCANTPCTQVCPVGASYSTKDGVVMVDADHCIGCGYCVQACPYGSRFLHPETHTASKCTLCYHRITKGEKPACVEICPTGTRQFGDLKEPGSKILELVRTERTMVLKPELLTKPTIKYIGLSKEVT